jgi:hypothetical protein
MNDPHQTTWLRSPVFWIMTSLFAWGLYLAIGTFFYGGTMAVIRSALILGCTLVFLLFWGAALSLRKNREKNIP